MPRVQSGLSYALKLSIGTDYGLFTYSLHTHWQPAAPR